MTGLLLLGLAGIALLLVLVLVVRLQPFVALLVASIAVGLAAGMPVATLAKTIEDALGGSLGHIALIISLGAMIGRMVEESSGATALAHAMIARFGDSRVSLALSVAGFLVGVSVFFEVAVIMLMPIAYGVARNDPRRLLPIALPMCATILVVHALLPPHPGAVAVATLLGADFGRILLLGLPTAALTAAAVWLLSQRLTRGTFAVSEDVAMQLAAVPDAPTSGPAPPVATVLLLILLPVALILGSTVAGLLLPPGSAALSVAQFLGVPFLALLADVLLAAILLSRASGWTRERVSAVMSAAVPGVALVILITGGGAIFAKILVTTGIGSAAAELLRSTGLPLLLLAFLLTAIIRAVQGPTTVALTTVAGIVGPFAVGVGLDANHLALLCLAMGSGGIAVSHVNDPGFWIVTRLIGLNVRDGLRTWTVLTTLAGLVGFALTCLLWQIV